MRNIQDNGRGSSADESEIENIEDQLHDLTSNQCRDLWKKLRKRRPMKQIAAAVALDIGNTRLNAYETGRSDLMSPDAMKNLIHLLATWCHEMRIDPKGYFLARKVESETTSATEEVILSGATPSAYSAEAPLDVVENLRANVLALCKNLNGRRNMEFQLENRSIDELTSLFFALSKPPRRGR